MNYFLVSNNKKIDNTTIKKISFNMDNDLIVLFNFLFPLKFKDIYYYQNKICVSRKRILKERQISKIDPKIKEYYCNMSKIKDHQEFFKQIIFVPSPSNIKNHEKEFQDNIEAFKFDTNKLFYISQNIQDIIKELNYIGTGIKGEISTGLLTYYFLKKNISNKLDKIILVGFTSELSNYHESEWEKNYFLDQIYSGKCYSIDSYGFSNFN